MKKYLFVIVSVLLLVLLSSALAESEVNWDTAPVLTKVYEQAAGKLYVEWEGVAPVYQVYVDGSKVADVIVNHHVINIEKGMHSIVVYPIYETRDIETKLDLNIEASSVGGGSISLDLAALGLDPKRLTAGYPSEKLDIDYKPSQILNGTPDKLSATTDPENRVIFTFADQFTADEYLLTIKHGNGANYLTYYCNGEDESKLISKSNTMVSLILDPDFLRSRECMIPELNEEYRFSVQLRKYGINLMNGEKVKSVVAESKVSSELVYRVTAAWKTAPVISFASQTADGQITLKWDHDDYGAGCEYAVMKINKVLGVMTGEEQLGSTTDHEFVVNDLTNGGYCINIVPVCNNEKGSYSADANIDLKNEWVIAPELQCEQIDGNQVRLSWKAPENIEKYHLSVFVGDSNSLLRFVDMDYKKLTEEDIVSAAGSMEYLYTYNGVSDNDAAIRLKFELYGIRHTQSGDEQKSAASSVTVVLE